MIFPDVLEQHRPRYHVAGVAHEILEQSELAWLKIDPPPGPRDLSRLHVELEIGDLQLQLYRARFSPTSQAFDAGKKLGKRERLDEVIIAAGSQSFNSIADLAKGAQE